MWRILKGSYTGYLNMALDEALMESSFKNPIVRFYDWLPSCVSLGYFQSIADINQEYCKQNGIDIVRRITGGRAIWHNKDEITYSVIAPEEMFGNVKESYEEICSCIIAALKDIGIESSIAKSNDIIVNGKKISGNAQTRINDVLLQHGTIIIESHPEEMGKILNGDTDSINNMVTSLKNETSISKEEFLEIMKEKFTENKDYIDDEVSEKEMKRAMNLVESKYGTDKWNKDMPGKERGICYTR